MHSPINIDIWLSMYLLLSLFYVLLYQCLLCGVNGGGGGGGVLIVGGSGFVLFRCWSWCNRADCDGDETTKTHTGIGLH